MPLTQIQQEVYFQVERFGLGVVDAFSKLGVFRESEQLPKQVLDSLLGDYLQSISLFETDDAYTVSQRLFDEGKTDFDPNKELTRKRKREAYSMLRFCLEAPNHPRQALREVDFKKHLPDFYSATSHPRNKPRFRSYYIAQPRLGFLRVDTPTSGSRNRIVTKLRRDVFKHRGIPAYAKLIQNGEFELALVTPCAEKAERLPEVFSQDDVFRQIVVHVVHLPELIRLQPSVTT